MNKFGGDDDDEVEDFDDDDIFANKSEVNWKILLVDDEDFCKLALTEILKSCGIYSDLKVFTASNGMEGLQMIKSKQAANDGFKLIFMDCNMPIMDGF